MSVEEHTPIQVPTARALLKRVLGLVVVAVVLVLVVSVLPGLADVRERFNRADPAWLAATFACVLASMLSYVAAVRGTLSRSIVWRASWNLGMAEQGSNVLLPTGGVGGPARPSPSPPSAPRSRPSAAEGPRSARSSWRTPWGRWAL